MQYSVKEIEMLNNKIEKFNIVQIKLIEIIKLQKLLMYKHLNKQVRETCERRIRSIKLSLQHNFGVEVDE